MVDEFTFPHGIYTISGHDSGFTPDNLRYGFEQIAKFIKLGEL